MLTIYAIQSLVILVYGKKGDRLKLTDMSDVCTHNGWHDDLNVVDSILDPI